MNKYKILALRYYGILFLSYLCLNAISLIRKANNAPHPEVNGVLIFEGPEYENYLKKEREKEKEFLYKYAQPHYVLPLVIIVTMTLVNSLFKSKKKNNMKYFIPFALILFIIIKILGLGFLFNMFKPDRCRGVGLSGLRCLDIIVFTWLFIAILILTYPIMLSYLLYKLGH